MKKLFQFLSICLLLITTADLGFSQVNRVEKGNLVLEDVPEIPDRVAERMLQYQNIRSAFLQSWDPAGEGMLISTRFGETTQLHFVKTSGGARNQITFFNEPVSGADLNPDPATNGFIFRKDVGGSEFYQIFYFDLDSGAYQMLTDGESRNGAGMWSNKGDRFTFYTTKRNGKDWDIHVGKIGESHTEPVLENTGTWIAVDWSPDDSKLLVIKYVSITESYYYIFDIGSKQLTQIHPTKKKIAYDEALWSKDGKGVYITSNEGSEFQRLRYYDLKTKKFTTLTKHIPWDVNEFDLSDDGKHLAFVTNEDAIAKLHLLDLSTKQELDLPETPIGQIYGLQFNPGSGQLGMVFNTAQTPGDVYTLDIQNMRLARWTYSEVGGLQTDNFVMPELVHYETFDKAKGKRRMIPAFYYKPINHGDGPFPVVISIHGGPESQYRPFFRSTVQYYANELGIAVLAPNVRGSSGYGKSYVKLDNGYKREDSVKDIGKLLDWVELQPELDANRVAVIGGSYGGYMTLASMTHFNDRLRAGIEIVGISNFVTFLENTKDYRRDLRRVEYGDERDPKMRKFLMKISPTTNAHKITKPMLVAQGLNDPRVPASESEQMVEVIRKNGGDVWYFLAKDEGHGFRKKSNRDYYQNVVALFLETFLLGDGETTMR